MTILFLEDYGTYQAGERHEVLDIQEIQSDQSGDLRMEIVAFKNGINVDFILMINTKIKRVPEEEEIAILEGKK